MRLFTGLSAFPITPMTPLGQVIADDLATLVRRIEAGGADSIGLLGSTGTYMFLDREQRRRAVATALAAVTSTPVIVGVGALRTDTACDLARDAAVEGASGLLLAPVSYTPLTEAEVYEHFRAVASATDLPLCIYSNPGTTRFTFSPALVARLAALPTVTAIKLPLPAGPLAPDLAAFRAAAPGLSIGYSGDWGCKDALLAGCDAWFSVAGGLWPEAIVRLARAAMAGDRAEADRQDAAFAPLWDLFRTHGGLRIVHAAAALMGLTTADPPRPLLPVDETVRARVRAALP
ncbi:dihydrodipicolinate synthase family protein [Brevundimonas sp. A19_0]|uniref:dihydrodipicolinate synthase family protein n=1 Tax=Brevundimonas sp. A19_0 TaxID=2821087 RepID=UPI001AD982CC|nr:dihydrodipicolinate synthase family protein [Brevundimonas sp. A19_0]MBO9502833.1 dihydrodipicolinate synthase family protein [Brevundimonas sp. A19_0]